MPTPLSLAKQCLSPEAAKALDEAVTIAHRRGHSQTTSLHAVSAFLSLPSSLLLEACNHARNTAYSSREQFKALELCLSVSLDHLPSSPPENHRPQVVSNSLMAAIKRSQANQRRQPETFYLSHQEQQQQHLMKVEVKNLILAILDDPVVNKAFSDAGFRSSDIKLAIIRPMRYSSHKVLPPPMLFSGFVSGGDENCKRIGEFHLRKIRKNPLLVGVSANDALKDFVEMVKSKRMEDFFPVELSGLRVICAENEIMKCVCENCDEGLVKLRFEEVGRMLKECVSCGVVVNFGELNVLLGGLVDSVRWVVGELGRLLEVYGGRVWLIGAARTYETYLNFVSRFPSIEKDWDLQLLSITSARPPMAATYPRSSLMESFVPFGGFFATPSDKNSPLRGSFQCASHCNEKCKGEVTNISNQGYSASVADQYQSSLPFWFQMSEVITNRGFDILKAKDDSMLPSAKSSGLNKLENICHHLHYTQPSTHRLSKEDSHFINNQTPSIVGFQLFKHKNENVGDDNSNKINVSSTESGPENLKTCSTINLQQNSSSKPTTPSAVISKSTSLNLLPKLLEKPSKTTNDLIGPRSPPHSLSSSSMRDGLTSPNSATSVTTDLGLGIRENQTHIDMQDSEMIYTFLVNRVGRQEEAISAVSQTIVHNRTRKEQRHGPSRGGDMWFNFQGPDRISKKKIALSLAEIIYGSKESLICADLGFDRQQMNGYDIMFRGKTVVDYIAGELSIKPLSVVYLENIENADPMSQKSLSQAVRTGRFSDSHGREVGSGNAIFITTSRFTEGKKILPFVNETTYYSEENLLKVKGRPIQILRGFDLGDNVVKHSSNRIFVNKRKLIGTKRVHKGSNKHMDLNLPAEECDIVDADNDDSESDPVFDSSNAWLEEFFRQVDKVVIFKPLVTETFAEKILKKISDCFCKIIGLKGSLEIDFKVMEVLAAACLLENDTRVDDWINKALTGAFSKVYDRYDLSSRSVIKLVTCEGHFQEDDTARSLLPTRIIIN